MLSLLSLRRLADISDIDTPLMPPRWPFHCAITLSAQPLLPCFLLLLCALRCFDAPAPAMPLYRRRAAMHFRQRHAAMPPAPLLQRFFSRCCQRAACLPRFFERDSMLLSHFPIDTDFFEIFSFFTSCLFDVEVIAESAFSHHHWFSFRLPHWLSFSLIPIVMRLASIARFSSIH